MFSHVFTQTTDHHDLSIDKTNIASISRASALAVFWTYGSSVHGYVKIDPGPWFEARGFWGALVVWVAPLLRFGFDFIFGVLGVRVRPSCHRTIIIMRKDRRGTENFNRLFN